MIMQVSYRAHARNTCEITPCAALYGLLIFLGTRIAVWVYAGRSMDQDKRTGNTLITICSRCKSILSETLPMDSRVSHGMCSLCLEFLEKQIRQNQKAPEHCCSSDTLIAEDYEK